MSCLCIKELSNEIKAASKPIPAPVLCLKQQYYKRINRKIRGDDSLNNEVPGDIAQRKISMMLTKNGAVEIRENFYGDNFNA